MEDADRPAGLLDDAAVESSAVVANNAMNRQRGLAGVNSYTRELGIHPLDVIITIEQSSCRPSSRPANSRQ